MEDLRKYLKPVRKALKLKQQEFAKLLGVSNVTLSYWEHGRLGMGLKNQKQFIEFCKSRGIKINY